jgi:flagellar basal body-associated protein FliL
MAKHTDNPENEGENLNEENGDDNFGLPDLDYKPLDATEEPSTTSTSTYSGEVNESERQPEESYSYTPEEDSKSNAPIIIAVIIGLVLVVAGFLIYQYVYKPKAEKAKKELLAKQEADKKRKDEEARLAKEKEEAEHRRLEEEKAATAVATTPAEGTIETLSARTGRYHVVISSDIDDDLVMDFAKKISAGGTSVKIIPPYGKKKFYRLTLGDFDTFADAQANADQVKSKYGDGVWVIKY